MTYYHQHFITIPGYKDYLISDIGNVYHKSGILMEPCVIKGVKTYVNKYNKYLLISTINRECYYSTCNKKTENLSKPEKLSLNVSKMLCASITLQGTEHIKYVQNNSKGVAEAIKWSEELEKIYYPTI